jgi:hypothetical protein
MRVIGGRVQVARVDNATGAIGLFGSTSARLKFPDQLNPYIVESISPWNSNAGYTRIQRHAGSRMNYITVGLGIVTVDFSRTNWQYRIGNDPTQEWARVTSNQAGVDPKGRTVGRLAGWPYASLRPFSPALVGTE